MIDLARVLCLQLPAFGNTYPLHLAEPLCDIKYDLIAIIMKMDKLNMEFGVDAKNNIGNVNQKSIDGALACLETFYYSFNNKDIGILKKIWYNNELSQLNNPLGGVIKGIKPITDLYEHIFTGQATVWVRFTDIVYYAVEQMIVFAGTEIGEFSTHNETIPLTIRTSRILGYIDSKKRWFQIHHHGSIDKPDLLHAYQNAVTK